MGNNQLKLDKDLQNMRNDVLSQVMQVSRSFLDAFMLHMIYNASIDKEKSINNADLIKEYREKGWKEALSKANGNEEKAYQHYISNIF